jgi:hypothetical protein
MLGDDVEQTAAAAVVVSAEARDDGKSRLDVSISCSASIALGDSMS